MNIIQSGEKSNMTVTIDTISDVHQYGLDVKNREIYLHGYICNTDEDPGVEYRMTTNLYKNIRILDSISRDPIIIHMHSIGGNWSDGMAIYDAILLCKSYVTIIAYGQAESMSSIILQAADRRVLTPNAHFMLHYGSFSCASDHLTAHNYAKVDKKNTETMIDIYSQKCMLGKYFKESYTDLNQEKVKNFIKRKLKDGDWYLEANEAVYYGFADYVLDTRRCKNIESLK
jgi:ATP-dependent protease ClpP protease subunit